MHDDLVGIIYFINSIYNSHKFDLEIVALYWPHFGNITLCIIYKATGLPKAVSTQRIWVVKRAEIKLTSQIPVNVTAKIRCTIRIKMAYYRQLVRIIYLRFDIIIGKLGNQTILCHSGNDLEMAMSPDLVFSPHFQTFLKLILRLWISRESFGFNPPTSVMHKGIKNLHSRKILTFRYEPMVLQSIDFRLISWFIRNCTRCLIR